MIRRPTFAPHSPASYSAQGDCACATRWSIAESGCFQLSGTQALSWLHPCSWGCPRARRSTDAEPPRRYV